MADFLTSIRTVRIRSEDAQEDALRPLRTKQNLLKDVESVTDRREERVHSIDNVTVQEAASPQDILLVLRSNPTYEQFIVILKQMRYPSKSGLDFHLHQSGSIQAQVLNTLLNHLVPTFWSVLEKKDSAFLLAALCSTNGVAAVVGRLRQLTAGITDQKKDQRTSELSEMLQLLDLLLRDEAHVRRVWAGLSATQLAMKRDLAWKEYITLIASGKVVSTVAQALNALNADRPEISNLWLANGSKYAAWLGHQVAELITTLDSSDRLEAASLAAAQILSKSLTLGYSGSLLEALLSRALNPDAVYAGDVKPICLLFSQVRTPSRRQLVEHLMRWLNTISPEVDSFSTTRLKARGQDVSAMASLLHLLYEAESAYLTLTLAFLSDSLCCSSLSLVVRRACVAAIARTDAQELQSFLERLVSLLGDKLFIDHSPIVQQEAFAQTMLITVGYLHRHNSVALRAIARSSPYMTGISNRLDTSSSRTRWLGMVMGTAVSGLIDKERMNFGTDDMQTEETAAYIELVNINDPLADLQTFSELVQRQRQDSNRTKKVKTTMTTSEQMPTINGKPVFGPPRPPVPSQTEIKGARIHEVLADDETEEDDDLKPYAKPDSDPEDSDEDATLVDRKKARPPVYIRDLMAMLRNDKSHDRFQLGVRHAAALIRRKSNFSSEVKDHAEELARILCNIQDPFDTEGFDELRLQALIAVVLCDPQTLAPWLSRQAFVGEYSLAQRCVMLSAIGLSCRELAGLQLIDEPLNPVIANTDFPTKRLPPHLHAVYSPNAPSVRLLDAASRSVESKIMQPLALRAADQSTSHLDAVKIRKFSSRVTTSEEERIKRKAPPNQLAKVFGVAYFFPLTARYQQEIAAYGSNTVYNSAPIVLVTFLKTLALSLHASGPATVELPRITAEYWDLLLSLRVRATSDISVLEAVLFSMLTLLEVSTEGSGGALRLAQDHGKQLIETKEWVEVIFERSGGRTLIAEAANDDSKVRTLAAGVLVKAGEIIGTYQKLLVGTMDI